MKIHSTINRQVSLRKQCALLFFGFLFSAYNAYAGIFDSAKQIAIEASEPIGIVIMILGGMRLSNKDVYSGVSAVVGGIFIFKAPEIIAALK